LDDSEATGVENANGATRDEIEAVVDGLTEQSPIVAALLESTAEEVRTGQVPDPRALEAASHFARDLERALTWLEVHQAPPAEPTVPGAVQALKELALRDQRRSVRPLRVEALARLQRAELPSRFDGDRATLLALVTDLRSAADWAPEQESLAEALRSLARICDLCAAGDPEALVPDIDLEIRPVLPAELHRLLSAATAGSVALPPVGTAPEAPPTAPPRMGDGEVAQTAGVADADLPETSREPDLGPPRVGAAEEEADSLEVSAPGPAAAPSTGAVPGPDAGSAVARLIEQRRYGLAGWLLRAMREPDIDIELLRAAALGEAIRSPAGIVTPAFHDVVVGIEERGREASEPTRLAAFAGATRAALVSPASGAADLVRALRYAVRGSTAADAIATAISEASSRGIAYAGAAMLRVRDVVELQGEVETLAQNAAAVLEQARSRTLKYAVATDVWKTWVDGSGVIAQVMRPVAENRVHESGSVLRQVVSLRSKGVLDRRLDDDHARIRPGRREKLYAGARRTLLDWANSLLEDAVRWATAVDALGVALAGQGHDQWRRSAEEALRAEVGRHAEDLFGALDHLSADPENDGRLRAAAAAARKSLQESLGLLRGEALPGDEITPPEALNGELLKVPGLALGHDLEPAREPTVQELVAAADCDDWEVVFRERSAEMDHDGTRALIGIVRRSDRELADRLESRREEARHEADRRLRASLGSVAADVERARRLGHVGDPDGLNLAAQVEDLRGRLERDEFASVGRELADLEGRLLAARESAQSSALERLTVIARTSEAVARHAARIRERIEQGDIVTADEFIAQAETTGELTEPEPDPEGLVPWYPQFVERLAATPLSPLAAEAVGSGERWEEFDFASVPANRRSLARRALQSWLRLRNVSAVSRDSAWAVLQDVLAPMGVRGERERRLGKVRDHMWWEVVGVSRTGGALVPHFGSASAGMDGTVLKLLVCWSAPSPETIVEWCHGEGGEAHVLVLYLGLLPVAARRDLAAALRRRGRKQAIAVVDDAVLLWLCIAPEPPFESLMRAVLPFTAINPYRPWSTGNVPTEMFYGRRRELDEVLAPDGTSFIFGGRQFGKSALLRRAERELGSGSDRFAAYVDVQSMEVGTRRPPEAIWEVLWTELGQRGLWSGRISGRNLVEQFAETVRDWLRRHPAGRVLLLLDECDRFLEADAQQAQPFATVRQLKSLREETRGRFKPVFAGLHLVQRYQDVPNQPLAHLGRPISIGPLHPRDAFDLISRPMNALGYRFASDGLVSRITAFCGNHPNLLQFFGEALVKHMLAQSLSPDGPPCRIAERDVEAVIADRELLNRFRERFRLTIELDPRYKVVADVIAYEAVQREDTVTMRVDEIRREAIYWWSQGFQAMQSEDAFRSVLDEMVGLGVLVSTANGYRMRTPNVLRLLGNADEIQSRLLAAADYRLPEPFEASSHRRPLPGDALSPFTEKQLGDLLKPRRRCVVVVGSEATAMGRVTEAVRQGAGETGLAVHVERVRPGRQVREPEPTGVHTIWVIDSTGAGWEDAERAAEKAATVAGRRAVTAVVLASAAQADWLVRLGRGTRSRFELMELRRLDSTGLRWMDQMPAYGSPTARETLLTKTGGWPVLVDQFRQRARGGGESFDAIMQELDSQMEDGGGLVDAVGLRCSPLLERVWGTLAELAEPGTVDELAGLLELEPDDVPALELLRMLGALAPRPDGRLVCEETLRRAWQRLTPA
jgi:hypothetical protein